MPRQRKVPRWSLFFCPRPSTLSPKVRETVHSQTLVHHRDAEGTENRVFAHSGEIPEDLVEEPSSDPNIDLRFFRIIGPEPQNSLVEIASMWKACETHLIQLSRSQLVNPVRDFIVEIELNRLNFERLIQLSDDVYSSAHYVCCFSLEINQLAGHMDGHFYIAREKKGFHLFGGIIRIDFGRLAQKPLVSRGIQFQRDPSLPAWEDGPVKVGHCAASPWPDRAYLKKLVPLIQDLKGMLDDFAFGHFLKIEFLLFNHHSGPGCSMSKSRRGKEGSQKEENHQEQKFLHGHLLGHETLLEPFSKPWGGTPHSWQNKRKGLTQAQDIVLKTTKVYHNVEKRDKGFVMTNSPKLL
jgi:hypothetical protein